MRHRALTVAYTESASARCSSLTGVQRVQEYGANEEVGRIKHRLDNADDEQLRETHFANDGAICDQCLRWF